MHEKELDLAKRLAEHAGSLLKEGFSELKSSDIKLKSADQIVTKYDIEAEKLIKSGIKAEFPDHDFLGEESGLSGNSSEFLWVVDPLDGTTNFSLHNEFFNTSIALFHKGQPLVGVVYSPMTDEMFWAVKGKGAFLNGRRIGVSGKKNISESVITFCSPKRDTEASADIFGRIVPKARTMRIYGAAALELAYVAAGRVEGFYNHYLSLWDVAAGALLVKEAGGRVTNFSGTEWTEDSKGILATNGLIHDAMLEELKSHSSSS